MPLPEQNPALMIPYTANRREPAEKRDTDEAGFIADKSTKLPGISPDVFCEKTLRTDTVYSKIDTDINFGFGRKSLPGKLCDWKKVKEWWKTC